MNFIPYPRIDKNSHADLATWRRKTNKRDSDWRILKTYLSDNCRLNNNVHSIPKCWYSELHQGDNYALDVEHFRPKNTANPLNRKDVIIIEKTLGFPLLQDETAGHNYSWLAFDYRNYRLVTATTNRGGAKHIYFPIFKNTNRLTSGTYPWDIREYPIFLDPADRHDATLLLVKPDGEIIPKAPKTKLTQQDIDNLPDTWTNDSFNYTRAVSTIKMYRLDEPVFTTGRQETYKTMSDELDSLLIAVNHNIEELIQKSISKITTYLLPSAQFTLASKCSFNNFIPDSKYDANTVAVFNFTKEQIVNRINTLIDSFPIRWTNP